MAESVNRRLSKKIGQEADEVVEFTLSSADPLSSPVRTDAPVAAESISDELTETAAEPSDAGYSPEFLKLAQPKLPALSKANRARLLMQSPNRLYFYWSIAKNPFHTLNRALGNAANYTLVLKLVDLRTGREEIHPVNATGSWWFDVEADSEYRAEIGFYAVNRPYVRILYSNTVTTPRKSPSPRTADTAEWRVPADRFARVLDAAGFQRDAFDVAMAGDDLDAAAAATRTAFSKFTGRPQTEFEGATASELRYALFALASGVSLFELRGLISEQLYRFLSSVLTAGSSSTADEPGARALAALAEHFEFDAEEFEIEEIDPEPIFGASLVSFPRKRRKRAGVPFPNPLSSHNIRPSS